MLKAKALAMCVCPVLAAPPAVLAVHAPARHAVAHMLHRAARHLDPAPERAPAIAAAPVALPCAPSLAGTGGGLPVVGGAMIGGIPEGSAAAALAASDASGYAGRYGSSSGGYGGYGGGGGGGGGYGGGSGDSGGIGGGAPAMTPVSAPVPVTPPGVPLPGSGMGTLPAGLPTTTGSAVSGAPEPAAWAFMVVGFGLVGALTRGRRFATGAAGED